MFKRVLIISDTHIPYHVKELIPFLTELKKIVNDGVEIETLGKFFLEVESYER